MTTQAWQCSLSADPGFTAVSGGITSPFRAWFDKPFSQSIRAWFAAPFQLRIQDSGCEAAFRRGAATNLSATAVTTVAPVFAAPQASATPQTAASPAPFCFTGGKEKAAAPTTVFPFNAPGSAPTAPQTKGPSTSLQRQAL